MDQIDDDNEFPFISLCECDCSEIIAGQLSCLHFESHQPQITHSSVFMVIRGMLCQK